MSIGKVETRAGDGIWGIEGIAHMGDHLLVTASREIQVQFDENGNRLGSTGETAQVKVTKVDIEILLSSIRPWME